MPFQVVTSAWPSSGNYQAAVDKARDMLLATGMCSVVAEGRTNDRYCWCVVRAGSSGHGIRLSFQDYYGSWGTSSVWWCALKLGSNSNFIGNPVGSAGSSSFWTNPIKAFYDGTSFAIFTFVGTTPYLQVVYTVDINSVPVFLYTWQGACYEVNDNKWWPTGFDHGNYSTVDGKQVFAPAFVYDSTAAPQRVSPSLMKVFRSYNSKAFTDGTILASDDGSQLLAIIVSQGLWLKAA